jgi:hypothetical protein
MKAKTLLIAAAALAAGVISSQAQVYSQNVVGYANVATPSAGSEFLITVPFTMGVSNGVNEVFGSSLPAFSSLLIWNGTGYNGYLYDPTDPNGVGAGAPVWYLTDDTTPAVPLPTLPVGQGFFLAPNSAFTNTFVGAVAINVGTSNNMALPLSGHDYLVASVVPYGGTITNGTSSTGGPNLNNLPAFSSLLFWNGTAFNTALYDPTDPNGVGAGAPLWYKADDTTPYVDPTSGGNVPTIAVGQGFFLAPNSPYTWTTGL